MDQNRHLPDGSIIEGRLVDKYTFASLYAPAEIHVEWKDVEQQVAKSFGESKAHGRLPADCTAITTL